MRTKSPCKDCLNRQSECHSSCQIYLDWQQTHISELRAENSVKYVNKEIRNHKSETVEKIRRSKHAKR